MPILEMLDVLNETLIERGDEPPVASEHDCREGICGSCGFLINGVPHGPRRHTTVCTTRPSVVFRPTRPWSRLGLLFGSCSDIPRAGDPSAGMREPQDGETGVLGVPAS
jgi:hypothetical protein